METIISMAKKEGGGGGQELLITFEREVYLLH